MSANRDHQRAVKDAVAKVLHAEAEQQDNRDYDPNEPKPQNLAEQLAIFVAEIRATGEGDESFLTEVLLRSLDLDRESLLEARRTLAALGYGQITPVLKRVARTAPRREHRLRTFAPSHRQAK